jgi:hypothetical protein
VDEITRVELFGTMREVTIRNNGLIRMRIHKAQYTYRIDDYEIIANYRKVNLYYDLEDLSKVYLFAPGNDVNAHFLCEVMEEEAIKLYGPNADYEALAKAKAKRRKVREQRDEELAELVGEAASEVAMIAAHKTDKETADSAQDRWLKDRVGLWQDKGEERRISLATVTADDDEEDEDIELVVRRDY